MIYGGDFLGGINYLKELLEGSKQGDCAGIFLRTFGDARKTVDKMGASKKLSEIVVHLAPFDRSHLYPISNLKPQLIKDAKWLEGIAQKYPNTKFLLSPFCEHNHPASKMIPLFQDLKKVAPSCLMVNTIWKGDVIPGIITEIHLTDSKPRRKPTGEYIIAFDGFGGDGTGDYPDADIPTILARYSDARQIRGWDFEYNGKYGHADPAPVSNRKNWPNVNYIKSRRAMMKNREGTVTYPANALYKPCADDHDGPQAKDNLAMVITKRSADALFVLDSKGNKIDTMKRMLPDHTGNPKGARYYSKLYSNQLGDLAEKGTGSRLISIGGLPLTDADLRSSKFK